MPLPAILAAVGRVAAAGAQAFGSQAARTAATGAGQAVVRQSGSVLTEATTNAKDVTRLLRGGLQRSAAQAAPQAAAGQAAGGFQEAGAAARLAAQSQAQQAGPSFQGAGQAARRAAAEQAKAAARSPAPSRGDFLPPQAGKNAAQAAPTQPTSKASALEKLGKFAEGLRGKYDEAKARFNPMARLGLGAAQPSTSVADDTKGMSLDQRYQRLKQVGSLLSPSQVAQATGRNTPSREDAVNASEKAEQQRREESDKNRAKSQGAGTAAAKTMASAGLSLATLQVTWPLILAKTAHHLEQWGTGVLESSRDLRRFDSSLARTFAVLDRQQLMLQVRSAQATGGSASTLGKELQGLRKELQPFRENATIALNLIATHVVDIARAAVMVSKWAPVMQALGYALRYWEEQQRKKNPSGANEFDQFTADIIRGNWSQPRSKPPGDRS